MRCPECDAETVPFAVPPALEEYAPENRGRLSICTQCLTVEATDEAPADEFSRVSDEFPTGEAGVAMAMALGLLESLALNRRDIVALFEHVEREGADPFLVLDRLQVQGSVSPDYGLERRRRQLEQLME